MTRTGDPVVDVIVAVHNDRRPVERAVASALRNRVAVRVSVVAHNVDPAAITGRLGELSTDDRIRVLPLADGVRSPANAYNHGLDNASAEYVAIVGSDDELEPTALDAWVALARRADADAVVAPIVRDGGGGVPTPRVRRSRFGRPADLDRDRLFERTAPLGLQRLRTTAGLRYAEGLPRGVDQAYGLELWSGHRVVFDPSSPAYLEHADQNDRITHVFGPLADDFVFLETLRPALERVTPAVRRGVVAKILRVHLIPGVRVRAAAGSLTDDDREHAAALLAGLGDLAPGAAGLLPRDHRDDLRAIAAGTDPSTDSRGGRSLAGLLPIDLRATLHRHGPLRTQAAGRRVSLATAGAAADRVGLGTLSGSIPTPDVHGIVVLAPHGSPIADRLRAERDAVVVGYDGSGATLGVPRFGRLSATVRRLLGSSFPGRLLSRLLGVDESTRFAAAVARTPAVVAALSDTALIVAADEDAVLAAWRAGRRRTASVVFGHAAAEEALAEGRPNG